MTTLDARSRRLVAAVLVAPSIAEAARRVGYSEKTARRMLARPEVRARSTRPAVLQHRAHSARSDPHRWRRWRRFDRALPCGVPTVEVAAARGVLHTVTSNDEVLALKRRVPAIEARHLRAV